MSVEQRISYWATIQLYRTYLFEDGPFLEMIRDAGGNMDSHTLSRIAYSYAVSRTIPAPPKNVDKSYNLELFARAVLNLQKNWPSSTQDRAQACRTTTCVLAKNFSRRSDARISGAPHSAVTKLIWFLEPTGWTVYDRLAANAVPKHGEDTEQRQERFYNIIKEPLAEWSDKIRQPLSQLDPKLHAERLIDKYLLITGLGTDGRNRANIPNVHFLRLLPNEFRKRLVDVSTEVALLLPNNAFPKEI